MLKLSPIRSTEELIAAYPLIKEIPLVNGNHEEFLSHCLTGLYKGLLLCEGDKVLGVVFYQIEGDRAHIPGLWCKNNTKKFISLFDEYIKEQGVKKYTSVCSRNPEAYAKLTGMNLLYSMFEKEVCGG